MSSLQTSIDPQERMIRQQIIERGIDDARVLAAFRAVPRDLFVPPVLQGHAFADCPQEIGRGQTISQPYIVALMTQRLDVLPEHRVLEIGTGSGYQTAILAHMAKSICTVERIKPLLDDAFERLSQLGLRNIRYRFGDGITGFPDEPPFDRIILTAAASDFPRGLLLSQLRDGGVAVLPVKDGDAQSLLRIERQGDALLQETICAVRFVPIISGTES